MTALVIGCDEFLGAEVCQQLLNHGQRVKGISLHLDAPQALRERRINRLERAINARHFEFMGKLTSLTGLQDLQTITDVYFLPEYDCELPYLESVLHLSMKVLSICEAIRPRHLVFASHYSVYSQESEPTLSESMDTHCPNNIVSGILNALESILRGFCAQQQLPVTVLRLFEIYGKDAETLNRLNRIQKLFLAEASVNLDTIENTVLDYTNVHEAAKMLLRAMQHIAHPNRRTTAVQTDTAVPWQLYNLGTGIGTSTSGLFQLMSDLTGKPLNLLNSRSAPGTVRVADANALETCMGLKPTERLTEGLSCLFDA